MERARLVAQLWDWLPAFRAVAETQHLPTAAQAMRISPSALSRAVGLLEDVLGHTLFDRMGRRLVLNERGAVLLEAVRDAMRGVHSALDFMTDALCSGPVRLSVPVPWMRLLLPEVAGRLAADHPKLIVHASSVPSGTVPAALRHGDIDVAILDEHVTDGQLTSELLQHCPLGVFVVPSHRLASSSKTTWSELTESGYIATAQYGRGVWEVDRVRPLLHVDDPDTSALLCGSWNAFTVLPEPFGRNLGLVRVNAPICATVPLLLLRRPTLALPGSAEAVEQAVQATLLAAPWQSQAAAAE